MQNRNAEKRRIRKPSYPAGREAYGHRYFTVIALEPYGTIFDDRLDCRASCSASFSSARTGPAQDWRRTMGKAEHDYAVRHLACRSSAGNPHFKALTQELFVKGAYDDTLDGMREARDGVLRTESPQITVPLAEIFS